MRPVVLLELQSPALRAHLQRSLPALVAVIPCRTRVSETDDVVGVVSDDALSTPSGDRTPTLVIVLTHAPPQSLPATTRHVQQHELASGIAWLSDSIAPALAPLDEIVTEFARSIALTTAEERALRLLFSGHSVRQSAERAGLSPRSIEHQHLAIRKKARQPSIAAVLAQFAWFSARALSVTPCPRPPASPRCPPARRAALLA